LGSARRGCGWRGAEVVLEVGDGVGLRPVGFQVGPPQLPGDEKNQHESGSDEKLTEDLDHCSHDSAATSSGAFGPLTGRHAYLQAQNVLPKSLGRAVNPPARIGNTLADWLDSTIRRTDAEDGPLRARIIPDVDTAVVERGIPGGPRMAEDKNNGEDTPTGG